MTPEKLKSAGYECVRFLERLEELEKARGEDNPGLWENPKQCGAVRRASMDLTRALAELRKPGA